MLRINFTMPFLKYKRLKLKIRLFSAGHSVAMVANCVTKMIPTCSPMTGQCFDTMIVASIDKENLRLGKYWKLLSYTFSKILL